MFSFADNAPLTACNAGCAECTSPNDVVVFDVVVVHDENGSVGNLVLCYGCLMSAAEVAYLGRANREGKTPAEA